MLKKLFMNVNLKEIDMKKIFVFTLCTLIAFGAQSVQALNRDNVDDVKAIIIGLTASSVAMAASSFVTGAFFVNWMFAAKQNADPLYVGGAVFALGQFASPFAANWLTKKCTSDAEDKKFIALAIDFGMGTNAMGRLAFAMTQNYVQTLSAVVAIAAVKAIAVVACCKNIV